MTEVLFVRAFAGWLIGSFVCEQYFSKNTTPIFMKFCTDVQNQKIKKRLHVTGQWSRSQFKVKTNIM